MNQHDRECTIENTLVGSSFALLVYIVIFGTLFGFTAVGRGFKLGLKKYLPTSYLLEPHNQPGVLSDDTATFIRNTATYTVSLFGRAKEEVQTAIRKGLLPVTIIAKSGNKKEISVFYKIKNDYIVLQPGKKNVYTETSFVRWLRFYVSGCDEMCISHPSYLDFANQMK